MRRLFSVETGRLAILWYFKLQLIFLTRLSSNRLIPFGMLRPFEMVRRSENHWKPSAAPAFQSAASPEVISRCFVK